MSESDSKFHIILKIWCFILGLALLATGIFYRRWWKLVSRWFLVFRYLRIIYNHFSN
jgi:hypothetical protein